MEKKRQVRRLLRQLWNYGKSDNSWIDARMPLGKKCGTQRQVMPREKHLKSYLFVNSLQDLIWYNFNNFYLLPNGPCQKNESLFFLFCIESLVFKPGTLNVQQKNKLWQKHWNVKCRVFTQTHSGVHNVFQRKKRVFFFFAAVVCCFVLLQFQFCYTDSQSFPNYSLKSAKTKVAWEKNDTTIGQR